MRCFFMKKRLKMSENSLQKTVEDMFSEFITSQKAKNLSEVTIDTYRCHIRSISKHLDLKIRMSELSKRDLEAMVVSMRESGLAHNSISSYCRVLRTFLGWCRREGIEVPELPNIHDRETVKEYYTDAELEALLKRPPKNCSFCDFRKWVIVSFLMNCGCRASSIRNIKNRDVDLHARHITLRHTKTGKILNLKYAWEFIMDKDVVSYPTDYSILCHIAQLVNEGFYANGGRIRGVPVTIGGTSYGPPLPIEQLVKEHLEDILKSAAEPVDLAIQLCLYCMKTQIFNDGNKRAAVIFANHYLISQGGGLLVIPESHVPEFKRLLVGYYENRDDGSILAFMREKCWRTF